MEGGDGKKRKAAGPIALDWDKLLPPTGTGTGDEEPPPLVVVKEPMSEDDGDGGSKKEQYMKLPQKELTERISRAKNMLFDKPLLFPDGGTKMRADLEILEAEFERRKRLKDDDRFNRVASLAGESSRNGSVDGLSTRSPTINTSRSAFASHFGRNLDDEKGNGQTKAFGEQLSSLSRCCKNTGVDRLFSSQGTHKTGLSSRHAPFKSPSHLSVNIKDLPQADSEQLGSHMYTPSPKDASSCFGKKRNGPRFQPSRNSRLSCQETVVLVDEDEELEDDDQAEKVDESIKGTQIFYPSRDDPQAIEICYSDMECLAPESFLSSTIMNFYIRYLQKPTSRPHIEKSDYHFFNTYFYEKLKKDVLNKVDKETSFVKFRRWWKGVNLFEKAYIFLPIHQSLHWSLAIICIPDKEDKLGPTLLHLDSLGMHNSQSIFHDLKSFLTEEWKVLRNEEILEVPFADNIWDNLPRRMTGKVVEVPRQKNEYDCGLFVLFFMERFIDDAPERMKKKDLEKQFGRRWFKPEEASSLRRKVRDLLKEEFKNANKVVCDLDP